MDSSDRPPFTRVRIGGGALIGALTFLTMMIGAQGYHWVERTSDAEGNEYGMAGAAFLGRMLTRSGMAVVGYALVQESTQ